MILSDTDITRAMNSGDIIITPYQAKNLGTNSYDLTLAPTIMVYTDKVLDMKEELSWITTDIKKEGIVLRPGELYLGSVNEYMVAGPFCPQLEGKSSVGRLGISIHATAGFGDIGFRGHWTLEISVIRPVRIYPNVPIAQVYFFRAYSAPTVRYDKKDSAKYAKQDEPKPYPSMMWKNFKQ